MMTYSFEKAKGKCMYEHLYCCIKEDILQGVLKAEEKLPSKRNLSRNLGVSITTVETAYAQLLTEGYLYSKPKSGYFVSPLEKQVYEKNSKEEIPMKEEEEAADRIDFTNSGVAADRFPFSIWVKLLRQVMATEDERTLLRDRPAGGLLKLRIAIANYVRAFRGMDVSPEQVIFGAGTEYLYSVLIQLLGRELQYGVEDPGYTRLAWIYEKNDVTCHHIPMDHAGIRPDILRQSATEILHITPSHHFPTGIVMPVSRRLELLKWVSEKEERYIIEDDYDCEFRLSGKPIPTLQSIDTMEKVIYINTFSQSLAPAFRMSYLILPRPLAKRFYETLGFYSGTVSCFEQLTLAKFLDEGYFEKHINRMRNYYRSLRDHMIKEIQNSPMYPYIQISEEDSGVHFLLEIQSNQSDQTLLNMAEKKGLRISCVSQYYHDGSQQREHTLVLNYSGIPKEKVREAVHTLSDCVMHFIGDEKKES